MSGITFVIPEDKKYLVYFIPCPRLLYDEPVFEKTDNTGFEIRIQEGLIEVKTR
jgi:hypothetical protein